MILGVKSFHLALRTVLPAVGLLILIGVVLICRADLVLETSPGPIFTPDGSPPRPRQVSVAVSQPNAPGGFATMPRGVPELPSSQDFVARRAQTVTSVTAAGQFPKLDKQLPTISQPGPGPSAVGVGGLPVTGQLFPPMRTEPRPENIVPRQIAEPSTKRRPERPGRGKVKVADLVISNPILDENSPHNPLNKIPTMDLEVARRRAQHPQPLRSHSIMISSDSPQLSATVPRETVREEEMPRPSQVPAVMLEPIRESQWTASTTSAQPSPGIEEMRRRSPRQPVAPALDPTPPPPPPPLKTPRTMSSNQHPPRPRTQQPNKPETLDLLSVPRSQVRPSLSSASTTSKASSGTGRPATALSLGTMSTSVGPTTKAGQRSRSQSLSSRRSKSREVSHDIIFTDPRTPPPIPKTCTEAGSPEDHRTEDVLRQSPPPPYKATAPKTPRTSVSAPAYNMPPVGASLSLFPAPQSKPVSRPPTRTRVPSVSGTPPRSREGARASVAAEEHKKVQEQSIMLLKEIEYSQPIDVNEIVEQYLGKKPPSSPSTVILESVLNRPRPVPRTPETGRFFQMFKSEPRAQQVQRRRSLSCSSVKTRKSLLHDIPESPEKLPALPPMPLHDEDTLRPLLRDAKSMTFEEKMTMFFPRSPSAQSGATRTTRRRSSSLFEMASSAEHISKPVTTLPPNDDDDDEVDKRTSRSSATTVRTHSLFNIPEQLSLSRQPSKLGASANQLAMEEVRQSQAQSEETARSLLEMRRQSSPVLPATDLETPTSMSEMSSTDEDYASHRESVETTTKTIIPRAAEPRKLSPVSMKTITPEYEASDDADSPVQSFERNSQHVQAVPIQALGKESMDKWHRRIGDECPTFSNRKGLMRPRKLTPPKPLPLGTSVRGPVLVAAEPSPLESPTHALMMIEDQLKRLEHSDQQSAVTEQQRKTLIANLEMEMTMQESQWQMMRRDTIRDSLSTVTTVTPSKDPQDNIRLPGLPRMDRHSVRSSLAESRNSTHLLEASYRLEALSRRSMLSNAGSRVSFLTVSHPTSQIGSPTPPDTDESDNEETMEIPMILNQIVDMPVAPSLWRVDVPSPVIIASYPKLWSPTLERAGDPWFNTYLASQKADAQPTLRKDTQTLEIETSELWRPVPPPKPHADVQGLWKCTSARASKPAPATKPTPKPAVVARKPSRKSKRITELPDIPESPQPLPDSRGTLGIFQFPWGEISDVATVPGPTFTFSAMPGTMTSGHTLMSSFFSGYGQQEPRRADSYFDEMDEEENAGDNFSDIDSDDDDFDESTLWEIASLLQSNQVPSRQSLLPGEWLGGRGGLNRQYLEAESPTSPASPLPPCEEVVPLVLDVSVARSAPVAEKPAHKLWESKSRFYKVTTGFGLTQPSAAAWASYTKPTLSGSGAKKGDWTDATVTAAAGSLWSKTEPAYPSRAQGTGLWNPKQEAPRGAFSLWRPTSPMTKSQTAAAGVGLPQPSSAVWASLSDSLTDGPKFKKTESSRPIQAATGALWSTRELSRSSPACTSDLWSSKHDAPQAASLALWKTLPTAASAMKANNATANLGLPEPTAWAAYTDSLGDGPRAKKTARIEPTATVAGSLWEMPDAPRSPPTTGLWRSKRKPRLTFSIALWEPLLSATAQPVYKTLADFGLPQPSQAAMMPKTAAPKEPVMVAARSLWSKEKRGQSSSQPDSGLWTTVTHHHRSHDKAPSLVSAPRDADMPSQKHRLEPSPAPQITSSTLWRKPERVGGTSARPNWIHINIPNNFASRNSASSSSLQRITASEADWAAALAEAVAASRRFSAPIGNGKFLWSSLSRQRRVPRVHVDDEPRLWVASSQDETSPDESSTLPPLPAIPRHKHTKSVAPEDRKDSNFLAVPAGDEFIGQGLWCRIEASSRVSLLAKQTDWILRCGM